MGVMKGKKNNQNNNKAKRDIHPEIGSFGSLLKSALSKQKEELRSNEESTVLTSASKRPKPDRKKSIVESKSRTIHPEIKDRIWERSDSAESLKINVPLSAVIEQGSRDVNAEEFYHWQISEACAEESELVIGLDFGTSCTKAVVRDNSLQVAYAVPFKMVEEINQLYLISTQLFVRSNGECSLKNGDILINDAKIQLMDNPDAVIFTDIKTGDKITALEVSIAYIALILREIRWWFFASHKDKYKNRELLWELNIGLPSRSYDDKLLHETFKLAALAGWNASTQPGKVSLDTVRCVLKECRRDLNLLAQHKAISMEDGQIHPESVNAVPEVISEIVGYAKSSLRREGLHLLIDIGAGTIDVTSFILYKDNKTLRDDLFTLLTTEVERYGAFMFHKHRLKEMKIILEHKLSNLSHLIDGMSPLPEINDYIPSKSELNFDAIDNEFIQKFKSVVNKVVATTRKERDPKSQHWKKGLPVFLCGGGSQLEIYRQAVSACSTTLTKTLHISEFDFKNIPKPDGLEAPGLEKHNYHRVAVAYGLSYTFDDVGRVVPPHQVEDIHIVHRYRDVTSNYIGAEMV